MGCSPGRKLRPTAGCRDHPPSRGACCDHCSGKANRKYRPPPLASNGGHQHGSRPVNQSCQRRGDSGISSRPLPACLAGEPVLLAKGRFQHFLQTPAGLPAGESVLLAKGRFQHLLQTPAGLPAGESVLLAKGRFQHRPPAGRASAVRPANPSRRQRSLRSFAHKTHSPARQAGRGLG